MSQERLRFKKSSRSGGNSNCVEVSHTRTHLRDSKNPTGPTLTINTTALITFAKAQRD
ncbi:DUF397 domain-containing protein [Actinokineospora sp. NBRC 105648]|uniref:DUF397 domain-containing protein n=1 Tax=Actinokineospora sp. NBRC 105648 TaxID=3032206 RepID=UPI0024A34516|nr:DUF397 domain-containing protein [Actinokineospora sp. NBRC 105648]GLZ39016.1 hypothetical protein Acsp05_26400 [Actinokineospora sp. NBRC 105648]